MPVLSLFVSNHKIAVLRVRERMVGREGGSFIEAMCFLERKCKRYIHRSDEIQTLSKAKHPERLA